MSTRRWRAGVSIVLVGGAIYACLMMIALLRMASDRLAPFAYTDITPAGAYPRALCPGERLTFDLLVTVARAPSIIYVAENWQGLDRTIPDQTPRLYIQERPKETRSQQSAIVPALSPGGWTYERAGVAAGMMQPALLLIPFEVRAGC